MKSVFARVKKSKGNIFAMLFAAVGMTGVLGVVGMQTVSGPITTITKVTQKNIVDTDLMTNARIVILNAGIQAAGGDADGDNYVEPAAHNTTCTANPTGGGCLPTDIGAIQTDPWGTSYGYCVWDHGLTTGSANRLEGKDSTSEPVIAIISAGRDKTFQTSCEPFDGSAPEGLQQVTGSDDSVRIYSYDAAVAGANGLWQLKTNDPTTAEIVKDLEIGTFDDVAGTGFGFDIGSGESKFPIVFTDNLNAWTSNHIAVTGGVQLDTQTNVTVCGAGDAGAIRYNSTDDVIEVCDGAGDWDGADETAIIDEDGDTQVQVEEGADDDTIRFDTAGSERMKIGPTGIVDLDGRITLNKGGGSIASGPDILFTSSGLIAAESGFHVNVDSDASGSGAFIVAKGSETSTSTKLMRVENNGDLSVDTNTLFVDADVDRVGVGTTTPTNVFEVQSTQDETAKFQSTQSAWIHLQTTNATGSSIMALRSPGQQWNVGTSGASGAAEDDFYVADITQGSTPFLIEHGTGRVGIGTTSPPSQLAISVGRGNTNNGVRVLDSGDSNNMRANIRNSTAGHGLFELYDLTEVNTVEIRSSGESFFDGGDVGIGETNPDTLLDVDGPIEIGAGTCNASGHGRLQYTALDNIQYCNGTSWQVITGYVDSLNDIGDVNVTGVSTGQTLMWDGTDWVATSTLNDVGTGDTDLLVDNDNDTKVQVEKNADEDYIRFDTAGSERMHIAPNGRIGINQDFDTTDTEATVAVTASAATSTGVAIKTTTNTNAGADLHMHASGVIAADNNITLLIDGTNSSAAGYFEISKDAKYRDGSQERLMRIQENGQANFYSDNSSIMNLKHTSASGQNRYSQYEIGDQDTPVTWAMGAYSQNNLIATARNDFYIWQYVDQGNTSVNVPRFLIDDTGRIGIGTNVPAAALDVAGTDAILFPRGIVGNRPTSPVNGMMRYNTATGKFEAYQGGAWQDILTSGAGNVAHALADADNDTKIQVEEGADDDTIRFDTAGTEEVVIRPSGTVEVRTHLVTGIGGGGVALSVNDGYGNANVTFNHMAGTPEQNGNAGRISVNTDAASNAQMVFQLKSSVVGGVSSVLDDVMTLTAGGNASLGGQDVDGKMTITSNLHNITALNAVGDGLIVLQDAGSDTGFGKMRLDPNAIQTSHANAVRPLELNPYGGGVSIGNNVSGNLDMNGGFIVSLGTPVGDQDAATKKYVDDLVAGGTGDAGTLDGLDSLQFIRSDANDNVSAHTEWQDNMDVRLGTGADFRMNFNGTDTVMRSYAHGARWFLQGEDAGGTNRSMIVVDPDGGVDIRHAGSQKLITTATGVAVTGRITGLTDPTGNQDAATKIYVDNLVAGGTGDSDTVDGLHAADFIRSNANDNVTGHTEWQDNMEVRLGNGADFRMNFNGTNTIMRSYAHGARWYLQGEHAGGTNRNMIIADPDGDVDLYYAGGLTFSTIATGAQVNGTTPRVVLNDTDAGHVSGTLYGSANGIGLLDRDGNWAIRHERDSDTRFLINNVEKMRLDSTGKLAVNGTDRDGTVTITGAPDINGANTAGQGGLVIQDSVGDSSGAKIRIDATEMQTSISGVASSLHLNPFGGKVMIGNGGNDLDINFGRIIDLTDPIGNQDAATKAYVDSAAANADTVDSLHAASFIRSDANDNVTGNTEWQDNSEIRLGTGADFRMDFDATNTIMRSYAHGARWYLQGEHAGGTNRNMIIADPDDSVYMYYQNAEKLRTSSTGVDVRNAVSVIGATSGNEGGEMRLYTSDPYDGTYDYYFIDAYQDDLRIGRAGVGTDFVLKNTGHVGIGTKSPSERLHVNGNILVSPHHPSLRLHGPVGNASLDMNGPNATKSFRMHYGDSADNIVRFGRFSNNFISWEANPVVFDLDAPDATLKLSGTGNVGIGVIGAAPSQKLHVNGNILASSYLHSSDRRLKKDIRDIDNPFDLLDAIHGKHFGWKKDDKTEYGVIAQDVQKVMPEAVVENEETGFLAVEYDQLIAPVIEAVKHVRDMVVDVIGKVESLLSRVDALEKENERLRSEIDALKSSSELILNRLEALEKNEK